MSTCPHIQWLDLEGLDRDWSVMHADRLGTVTKELLDPAHQYPSIVFFVGKRSKTAALQAMFRNNNITRHKTHGIGSLKADLMTIGATYPVLFTDCWPGAACTNLMGTWNGCHEAIRYSLNAVTDDNMCLDALISQVQARLLFTFVHVVCVFVNDLGGPHKTSIYIRQWIAAGHTQSNRPGPRPQLLVVLSEDSEADVFLQLECFEGFDSVFAALHLITSYAETGSSKALYLDLKAKLFSAIDSALSERLSMRLLFSALHLPYLFAKALKAFVSAEAQFDWLDASRSFEEPQEDRTECIRETLTLMLPLSCTPADVSSFVASALLMYCYPCVFDPTCMFDRVCYAVCNSAAVHVYGNDSPDFHTFVARTKTAFTEYFEQLEAGQSSHSVRCQVLSLPVHKWATLMTTRTCLWCTQRRAEYRLSCGHAICESCVPVFATTAWHPRSFRLTKCDLCGEIATNAIKLKPVTAAPSLLSLDGGGTKAVVEAEIMKQLQNFLGPHERFHDYFDLTIATSAGAFFALDHFVCGSSVEASLANFEEFAKQIFATRSVGNTPCQSLWKFVRSWFRDGLYDSQPLEQAAKQVFGTRRRLFDSVSGQASSSKIAITATSVADSRLCIFTNYNGVAPRREEPNAASDFDEHESGYRVLRPIKSSQEPYLWEVAMCTSAAPRYFRPKVLAHFGPLQDGGLTANCPAEPGVWELKQIWPSTIGPDVVISIGCGYKKESLPEDRYVFRGVWKDGFIPRTIRWLMSSRTLHAQNSWLAFINGISKEMRANYIRLNPELHEMDPEPELDDPTQMPRLRREAQIQFLQLKSCQLTMWARRFFFELDDEPEYRAGAFVCRGKILCRSTATRGLLKAICHTYPTPFFMLNNERRLGEVTEEDCCAKCDVFEKRVMFEVRQRDTPIAITINYRPKLPRHISASPAPVNWFIEQQQLGEVFFAPRHIDLHTCGTRGSTRKRRLKSTPGIGRHSKARRI